MCCQFFPVDSFPEGPKTKLTRTLAQLRELREETGYIGTVANSDNGSQRSVVMFNDPGELTVGNLTSTQDIDYAPRC